MSFEDAYEGWTEKRLTQIDAAQLLGGCLRTFRRTINPSAGDDLKAVMKRIEKTLRGALG